jgi:UDP-3-O-[3-hydroxymyristoyl] N-acetylglucosamine deacetylase
VLRASGRARCEARVEDLRVVDARRATTVECLTPGGPLRVRTVEHLFAALAGLGVRGGLIVDVEGPELPLLDGCASLWTKAVGDLALPSQPPALRVTRAATVDVGASRYELRPGDATRIEVVVDFGDPRLDSTAVWGGDAADFRERLAPARTFALSSDFDELLASGLARHVEPGSVVLIAPGAVHAAGRAFAPDEPARHKLVDLMGDLYLPGGPPLGTVRAFRPGHAANAEAVRIAIAGGLLVPR